MKFRILASLLAALATAPATTTTQAQNVTTSGGGSSTVSVLTRLRAGAYAGGNGFRTNPALTFAPAWQALASYWTGDQVSQTNGSYTYTYELLGGLNATSGGVGTGGVNCTSASSGGPVGSLAATGTITDGTTGNNGTACLWIFVGYQLTSSIPVTTAPVVTTAIEWAASSTYAANAYSAVKTGTAGAGGTGVISFWKVTAGGGGTGSTTKPTCGTCTPGVTTFTDGALTWTFESSYPGEDFGSIGPNSYIWNAGAGNLTTAVNIIGGTPVNQASTGALNVQSICYVNGITGCAAGPQTIGRIAFTTAASQILIRSYEYSTGGERLGICNAAGLNCQYYSINPLAYPYKSGGVSGSGFTAIDFSAISGKQVRTIVWEQGGYAANFQGIDVSTIDAVTPSPMAQLPVGVCNGDSYTAPQAITGGANGGTRTNGQSWCAIIADQMGFNLVDAGIPGTGYEVVTSYGTALSRIADVTGAKWNGSANVCPDFEIDDNGSNDIGGGFTTQQFLTAAIQFYQAVRAACPTMPIFRTGLFPINRTAAPYLAAEQALATQIAAQGDPLWIFLPVTTATQGTLQSGTGWIGSPAGSGLNDQMLVSNIGHMNALGSRWFANFFQSEILAALVSKGY